MNEHPLGGRNVNHIGLTVPDLDDAIEVFVDLLGCDLLYRKGPFGDSDGDSMKRRLAVHPDATAELAMLRAGPTLNLELFEWDAPDQDTDAPRNSDVGATHIALDVENVDAAVDALDDREDVTVLDEPQTNGDGPTAGLRYVYCQLEWGFSLELFEQPDEPMPYTEDTDTRLYGPAPAWDSQPDFSE